MTTCNIKYICYPELGVQHGHTAGGNTVSWKTHCHLDSTFVLVKSGQDPGFLHHI